MTGLLLAQLGAVFLTEAENVNGPPYAWPARPPMTDVQRREAERLRVIGLRFFYEARSKGQTDTSGDALWGEYDVPG